MMRLLSSYLMRAILTNTLMVMLVLLALAGLFEFIGQLEDTQGNYGVPQALLFAALRMPQLSFEMLPIAVLIGSLLGLGNLAKNSELVVMRTAGLSVARLARMVAISGAVLMIFTGIIGEYIGPPLDYFARTMRDEGRYEQVDRDLGNSAWVKDGQVIMHLERINPEFIDDNDKWILENFRETRFRDDGVQVVESSVAVESFDVNSELLGITLVKPVSLSARGLMSYINYLRKNDLSAERYETELWSRVSKTATVALMPVLALAFVFGSIVVTWLPSMVLLMVTALALSRVR
jgi:lipopolysaccharide export system permease protein